MIHGTDQQRSEDECLVHVPITCNQAVLHLIIQGLYTQRICLTASSAEDVLRALHFLGMDCIANACKKYLQMRIMSKQPVQVQMCCENVCSSYS